MNGRTERITVIDGTRNTLVETNRLSPNGGVNIPMATLVVMMMPKWTTSTPSTSANGQSSGVNTRIAEFGSMNIPAMSRITLIASRITTRLRFQDSSVATNRCGTCSVTNSSENTDAAATMTKILAVNVIVSWSTFHRSRTWRLRWISMETSTT